MLTQRLANKYPLWTKVRTDPSSLGYRLLSVYADYFTWAYADTKRMADDQKLIKRGLGIGYMYQLELSDEQDFITSTVNSAGQQIFTYPSVVADGITLTRVDNIDELAWSVPTRIEQIDSVPVRSMVPYRKYDGSAPITDVIDYPCHLLINVDGSTDYFHKTALRNLRASGEHLMIVKGRDINGTQINEYIDVLDDSYYWTRNVFTEIDEIIPEGFNGDISATTGGPALFTIDPFKVCVIDDGNEGPMLMDFPVDETGTLLRYYTRLDKQGEHYRDGVVEIEPNEEEAWEQYLLDSDGEHIEALDMAVHPNSTRLYVLDDEGFVHIYNHVPTAFSPPTDEETLTKTSYVEVTAVKPWARLFETMRMFTRFVRIRIPILGVAIKRITPAAVTEYLQADKTTWSASYYEFLGNFNPKQSVEQSWTDFDFQMEFDQAGQWEFYSIVRTATDRTVSYSAVMVDELTALASFDTELEPSTLIGLFFGPADELVITTDEPGPDSEDHTFYVFQEYGDYYIGDGINQALYFREHYDSVQIVTEYTDLTRVPISTGLDEIALYLGHQRIDGESLLNFHRRLILETREPAGPTQIEYIRSLARQVGEFDIPVLRIDLVLDGDGIALAEDPFIEVTSNRLRLYSNYADNELDVEVDFTDRTDGYFLRDVEAAISASSFFSVEVLDVDYELKRSDKLRYSNTDVHIPSELLLSSVENKLKNDRLKTFYPTNAVTFANEVGAIQDIQASGDYFVDYSAGVVYSFDPQSGFCTYTYSDFPFTLYWSAVKCYPYLDDDKKYSHKDTLISDETGLPEYTLLNSLGADIANTVLRVHPLTWGS